MRRRFQVLIGTAIAGLGVGVLAPPAGVAAPAAHAGWHFSKPYTIPHMRDAVNGLACPTPSECIAASANRIFWTTNATGGKSHWKNAALEPGTQGSQVGVILDDVTCASAKLCVAVDDLGNAFISTHPTGGKHAWAKVAVSNIELESVGCSSAGACATFDYYGAVFSTTHPGGAWTRGDVTVNGAAGSSAGVSCAAKLCAITAGDNKIATTTSAGGTKWHITKVKGSRSWDDVACPTTSHCVAVGGPFSGGRVAVSTNPANHNWTSAKLGKGGAGKIDCASASACFVLSDYSSTHPVAKKSAWHAVKVPSLGSQTAVSCPNPKRCYIGTATNDFTVGRR